MKQFLRDYQTAAMANVCIRDDVDVLPHLALGLTGEAGEVADIIKKAAYRGRDEDSIVPLDLVRELGDTLFYLSCIAGYFGYEISEVMTINAEKLADRYPNGPFAQLDLFDREEE